MVLIISFKGEHFQVLNRFREVSKRKRNGNLGRREIGNICISCPGDVSDPSMPGWIWER